MASIHRYDGNYYKPSESLSELFKELVVKPFEDPEPPLEYTIFYRHSTPTGWKKCLKTVLKYQKIVNSNLDYFLTEN